MATKTQLEPTELRMGMSCIVNGDWDDSALATGGFIPETVSLRWKERLECLERKVAVESQKALCSVSNPQQGERMRLRNELWKESGMCQLDFNVAVLSAAVGLGKTFSFLRLALRQAIDKNASHIFIVAPFNHVVDQLVEKTIEMLVLDDEDPDMVVAKHTCNADFDYVHSSVQSRWRCPITITSSVQFYETMSSNRAAKLVKFSELPDSVVVIDEWHMAMEERFLRHYWELMRLLSLNYGVSFILSSGSMTRYWEVGKNKFVNQTNDLKIVNVISDKFKQDAIKAESKRIRYEISRPQYLNPDLLKDGILNGRGKGKRTIVLLSTTRNVSVMIRMLKGCGRNLYAVYGGLLDSDATNNIKKAKNDSSDWILFCTTSIESGIDGLHAEFAFSVSRSIMSQIQLGGRVNRNCENAYGTVMIFTEDYSDDRFTKNPSFESLRDIANHIIQGGNIADADLAAKKHLEATNKPDDPLDNVLPINYKEVALRTRLIQDRGSVLCGPNAKNIFERMVRAAGGSTDKKDKVSITEISNNSVSKPAASKGVWTDADFIDVPGTNETLFYYDGGYDPDLLGIWKDKTP